MQTLRDPSFEMQEIRTFESLINILPEWKDLWLQDPHSTIFQSPEWVTSWLRYLNRKEFQILTFRENDRLLGLVPLVISSSLNSPNHHEIRLLGMGVSDYLDGVFDPKYGEEIAATCFECLLRKLKDDDLISFRQLRVNSPLLNGFISSSWIESVNPDESCPVLKLPINVGDLKYVLPTHQFQKLSYYQRRLKKHGHINFESICENNFDEVTGKLFQLHKKRWMTKNQVGVLDGECIQEFHKDIMKAFLRAGLLRFYALRINQKIVAVIYGYAHRKRFLFYLGGFDPEFEHLNVGTLMIGYAIEESIREGMLEFDFLRGNEPYKYKWGAKDSPTFLRQLVRRKPHFL
jgi:CelD/BcsL family acetyltransferase involved in cellulose biosynthesis